MIKLFAMDVDGTLTDGGIYMDGAGGEMKRFDVQDGQGIAQLLRKGGRQGRLHQRALLGPDAEARRGFEDNALRQRHKGQAAGA